MEQDVLELSFWEFLYVCCDTPDVRTRTSLGYSFHSSGRDVRREGRQFPRAAHRCGGESGLSSSLQLSKSEPTTEELDPLTSMTLISGTGLRIRKETRKALCICMKPRTLREPPKTENT